MEIQSSPPPASFPDVAAVAGVQGTGADGAAGPGALGPSEAFILLNPTVGSGSAPLKPALLHLLVQGFVRIERRMTQGAFKRQVSTSVLAVSPTAPASLTGPSGAVLRCLKAIEPTGETMPQVVARLRAAFGNDLGRFVGEHVRPSLIERGLLEPYRKKVLGLIPVQRFRPTPAGQVEQDRLNALVAQAKLYAKTRSGSVTDLAALVAGLGAAILIVKELQPHLGDLFRLLNGAGYDAFSSGGTDPLWTADHHGFDHASFDNLDTCLSDLDTSFDASGDSGGSDGGSCDSGGSSD